MQLKLKNTAIYTILGFLPLSFSLIFTPFYTQYLSKADYGLLNLFTIISGLLVPFFGVGIDQAFGFLYWDYNKDEKKFNEFISTTICLVFFIGAIIICFGFLLGPWLIKVLVKNGEHFTLWPFLTLSLIYPVFMITNRVLLYYYRNKENIKNFALLNVSSLILITAGSILGVISLEMGAVGAVEGRTVGFCVIILFFVLYEIKRNGISFNKKMAQQLLKMGGPLFFSTLIGSLAYVFDRIIVEQSGSLETLGIYGFAVTVASVIEILMAAFSNSFTPGVYKTLVEEDEKQYQNTHFQLFFLVFSLLAVVVLVTAITTPFVKFFISPNFFESIQYIPLLCLSFIPRVFTQIFSLKFYKQKKTSYVIYLNFAYFLSILVFGMIFYKFLGLRGIVLAVFLTNMTNMLVAYKLSGKIDPFEFKFRKLYILFSTIALCIISLHFVPEGNYQYLLYLLPLVSFSIVSIFLLKKEWGQIKNYLTLSLHKLSKR